MEFLTTLKDTVVNDDRKEDENLGTDRDRLVSAVESKSLMDLAAETGRTRKEILLALLAARGGRMRQAELVDLTGWPKSSVSYHLSDLEAEGDIVRERFGQGKVIFFPEDPYVDDDTLSIEAPQ